METSFAELQLTTAAARWEITFDYVQHKADFDDFVQIGVQECAVLADGMCPFAVFRSDAWSAHLRKIYDFLKHRIEAATEQVVEQDPCRAGPLLVFYGDLMRYFITGNRRFVSCYHIWDRFEASQHALRGVVTLPDLRDCTDVDIPISWWEAVLKLESTEADVLMSLLHWQYTLRLGRQHRIVPFEALRVFNLGLLEYVGLHTGSRTDPSTGLQLTSGEFNNAIIKSGDRILYANGFTTTTPTVETTIENLLRYMFSLSEAESGRVMTVGRSSHKLLHLIQMLQEEWDLIYSDAISLLIRSMLANANVLSVFQLTIVPKIHKVQQWNEGMVVPKDECWRIVSEKNQFIDCTHALTSIPANIKRLLSHLVDVSKQTAAYDGQLIAREMKHVLVKDLIATGLVCRTPDGHWQIRRSEKATVCDPHAGITMSSQPVGLPQHRVGTAAVVPGKRRRWTETEIAALLNGLEDAGHRDWAEIVRMEGFDGRLFHRTNVDLKDKWENLRTAAHKPNCKLPVAIAERIRKLERTLREVPPPAKRRASSKRAAILQEDSSESWDDVESSENSSHETENAEMQADNLSCDSPVVLIPYMEDDPPLGLNNSENANVCWLNALIQCMSCLCVNNMDVENDVAKSFEKLLRDHRAGHIVDTRPLLWECKSQKRFRQFTDGDHHDALEFMQITADFCNIRQQCAYSGSLLCRCDTETTVHEFISDCGSLFPLILPLPAEGSRTLDGLVANVFSQQRIRFDECANGTTCQTCNASSRIEKLVVDGNPANVILKLRRDQGSTSQDDVRSKRAKRAAQVDKSNCRVGLDSEHLTLPSGVYRIAAVLLHKDEHYTAHVRRGNSWFHCNDETVTSLTWQEVAAPSKSVCGIFACKLDI
jgi:hypothetical protein